MKVVDVVMMEVKVAQENEMVMVVEAREDGGCWGGGRGGRGNGSIYPDFAWY